MAVQQVDLGNELDWTEEELDALSEMSQADILSMLRFWRTSADAEFSDLLDAEIEEEEL